MQMISKISRENAEHVVVLKYARHKTNANFLSWLLKCFGRNAIQSHVRKSSNEDQWAHSQTSSIQ